MPEMLTPTSAIVGAGLHGHVALMTDGRFSGGSHGFLVGHITPEAQDGGPIALVEDGDLVTIPKAAGFAIDPSAERRDGSLLTTKMGLDATVTHGKEAKFERIDVGEKAARKAAEILGG